MEIIAYGVYLLLLQTSVCIGCWVRRTYAANTMGHGTLLTSLQAIKGQKEILTDVITA